MHSPLALIHAVTILNDIMDIQISFCKIVISIAKSDEVSRENFIRFHIQEPLIKLILKQHSEISKLACITIKELCVKEYDIKCLCETTIYHHHNIINNNNNSNNNNNNNQQINKQIPSDYDIKDIENLLDSQLWNKEKCIIS